MTVMLEQGAGLGTNGRNRGDSNRNPLVSVIICTYNGGPLLRDAIGSIVRQTYRNLEVLVVDDGSTDGSFDAVQDIEDPRIRWIRQTRAGKSVALNRALSEMKGEFYIINDADDESYPHRVERQVAAMLEHPELAVVFCGYDLILNDRRIAPNFRYKSPEECRRIIDRFAMPGHDPTAMWRMSMVRDFRYDETLKIGVGYDYMLRVGEKYPMMVLGELLYSYRVDTAGLTRKDPGERLRYVKEVQRRARIRRGMSADALEAIPSLQVRRKYSNKDRDNNLAARFVDSVVSQRLSGKWAGAFATGLQGAMLHPLDPYYYKALGYALAPSAIVKSRVPAESIQAARAAARQLV
jgi:glycosyltransferase involved in cell wall biosynthesis